MIESPPSRHGRLNALIGVCSVALLAPFFGPLLTGRVFVKSDLAWFHLPTRYLYQQALQSGDTVLWTPSIFAGLYLHGEGQVGPVLQRHGDEQQEQERGRLGEGDDTEGAQDVHGHQ